MGGSSDSGSGSDSGRSNTSFKKDKKDKKYKKYKKDKKDDSGDEHEKKDKKDKKDKSKDKDKKDKKDDKHKDDKHKDDKHKDEHKDKPSSQLPTQIAHALSGTSLGGLAQEFLQGGGHGLLREGGASAPATLGAAPRIPSNPSTGPGTGASGQRIPCSTTDPFPSQAAGPAPPFVDPTGQPAYVGSAIINGSNVQPCRITASGGCFIASNGAEEQHSGRYDLLPLTDAMEWVQASGGAPPAGKRVVEGGIENGSSLYHACARVGGVLLPGKAGPALGGAQIPAGGTAHFVSQDYFVLSWRE